MKFYRGIAVAAALLCVGITGAANAAVEWTREMSPVPSAMTLSDVRTLRASDGSIYVTGAANPTLNKQRSAVTKLSAAGTLLWSQWLNGTLYTPDNIAVTSDNGVFAVTYDTTTGNQTLARISPNGDLLWAQPSQSTRVIAVAVSGESLFIVTTYGASKLSSEGSVVWSRSTGYFANNDRVTAVPDADGGLWVAGQSVTRFSGADGHVTEVTPFATTILDMTRLNNGDFVFIEGYEYNASSATVLYRLRSVDASGLTRWTQQYAVAGSSAPNVKLFATSSGGVYVTHARNLQSYGDVALINASGAVLWNRNYFRIDQFVARESTLYALRYDAEVSGGINGFFPIQPANGDLGAPGFTTTNPPHRLTAWTGSANGFVALSTTPSAQRVLHVALTGALQWSADSTRLSLETYVDRETCLMPRLMLSSPARVATFNAGGIANYTQTVLSTTGSDGAAQSAQPIAAGHCSTALDNSSGTYQAGVSEVSKVDALGATVWTTPLSTGPFQQVARLSIASAAAGVIVAGQGYVTKLSAIGAIVWETSYSDNQFMAYTPRYVYEDAGGNVIVAGRPDYSEDWAVKISAAGAIVYRQLIGTSSCSEESQKYLALPTGELYMISTACNEGRVFKYSAAGALLWQRTVSPVSPHYRLRLGDIAVSNSGDVFVGGCSGSSQDSLLSSSVIQSFTSAGGERWTWRSNVVPDANECVVAMAAEGTSRLVVAVESTRAIRANYLSVIDAITGAEISRSNSDLSNPAVIVSDLVAAEAGRVYAFGDDDRSGSSARTASLRKINVSLVPTVKPVIVSAPVGNAFYKTPFNAVVGLQTTSGGAYVATTATEIFVSRGDGAGTLTGPRSCVVAAGQSSCTVVGLVYSRAETGVTLVAEVDGTLPAVSSAFTVAPIPTTTTIDIITPGPYLAFDRVVVRYSVTGLSDDLSQTYLNKAYGTDCTVLPPINGYVRREECRVELSVGITLDAAFYSYEGGHQNSNATPFSPSVSPVQLTLQAASLPSPNVVVGTQFLLTLNVFNQRGDDLSNRNSIYASAYENGGYRCGLYSNTPSKRTCSVSSSLTGMRTFTISVNADSNISVPASAIVSVNVISGLAVTGAFLLNGNTDPAVCASAPGADCEVDAALQQYYCTLPIGWSGTLYPQVADLTASTSPSAVVIRGEAGIISRSFVANPPSACSFDTDGNGAADAMIDGGFIIRAMRSVPAAVNEATLVNACARRAAPDRTAFVNNQIATLKYDIDGNGRVDAATDGLIILRALLGFKGDALILNAIGAGASRTTWYSVREYMSSTCGLRDLPQ
jgi:hypothetical protein